MGHGEHVGGTMGRSERSRARTVAGAILVALVTATLAGFTPGTAGAAGGTLAKNDPGIGSAEALASPKCDPATKRVKFQSYSAPLCVKPWKDGADNGGATAQGVTAKAIKVAVLYGDLPREAARHQGSLHEPGDGREQPDRARSTRPRTTTRSTSTRYETWGRTVEFTFVKSTGSDEAAQRADAVEVAALKPFAVLDEATLASTRRRWAAGPSSSRR